VDAFPVARSIDDEAGILPAGGCGATPRSIGAACRG